MLLAFYTERDSHTQTSAAENIDGRASATDANNCINPTTPPSTTQPPLRNSCPRGRPPRTCGICGKRIHSSQINRHMRTHSGERPFTCHLCHSAFTDRGNLKRHMAAVHTGERRFVCHICSRAFSSAYNLKIHVQTHTNEKPFSCDVCKKRFIQSGNLKLHLRTHSGEKPFTCSTCQGSFKTSTDLNAHLRVHSGCRPYMCYMCEKRFSQLGGLKKHMKVHQERGPESDDPGAAEPVPQGQ